MNKRNNKMVEMEWHIYDFPDTVRVYLKDNFREKLYKHLLGKFGTRAEISRRIGVSTSIIKSYLQIGKDSSDLKTYILVKNLKKIIEINDKFSWDDVERNTHSYRARAGWPVYNPKLPIKETPEVYSIIAHMICDGSAGVGKTPYYSNIREELLDKFERDLQVFGKVETNVYKNSHNGVYFMMFPKVVSDILSHIFQIKFVRTEHVPKLVFQTSYDCKSSFLRACYDDEGSVVLNITFVSNYPSFMEGLKILLKEFDVKTGKISPKKGCNSYSFNIFRESYENFLKFIGFTHKKKLSKLKRDIIKIKNKPIPLRDMILSIDKSKWPMTSPEIAKELSSNFGTTKNMLHELARKGKLKSRFNGKNNYYLWFKID